MTVARILKGALRLAAPVALVSLFAPSVVRAAPPAQPAMQLPQQPAMQLRPAEDNIRPEDIRLLGPEDKALYIKIYAEQARYNWHEADRLIRRLKNRILVGQVLADRYLGPHYRTPYEELARWMKNYSDLPMADRVYELALKRKPRHSGPLTPADPERPDQEEKADIKYSAAEVIRRRAIRDAKADIYSAIGKGEPARAERRFWAAGRALFSKNDFNDLLSKIAASYFYSGNDAKALALGKSSGAQDLKGQYDGNWIAGLAAWRSDDCKQAAAFFEKAAATAGTNPWKASGASFWAARAQLACREPVAVNTWLDQAARHTRTFYGMVAARQLGRDISFSWDNPPLSQADYRRVMKNKAAERAVALWQVGKSEAADWEMRYLWRRSPEELHPVVLGLAARLKLPSTQIRVAKMLERKQIVITDSALFPMPAWQPQDGFKLDRALLYAFMRQESEFSPRATSSSGARGLMQLMPATASYIARDKTLNGRNDDKLYEPGFNMQLGQRYIEYLMGKDYLGHNLFFVAGAYNGGPGNLGKWLNNVDYRDDPLLFLEAIPAHETRDYVEKVMANFWVYQMRMGQSLPSLDAVAAGGWPIYKPQDQDL